MNMTDRILYYNDQCTSTSIRFHWCKGKNLMQKKQFLLERDFVMTVSTVGQKVYYNQSNICNGQRQTTNIFSV